MTIDITIALYVITGVISLLLYIWKLSVSRIEKLEKTEEMKPTKEEVRQLLDDKLQPVTDDLIEIKTRVETLINFIMTKK